MAVAAQVARRLRGEGGREARGERREARGERRAAVATGERREARGERREARGKWREVRGEQQWRRVAYLEVRAALRLCQRVS